MFNVKKHINSRGLSWSEYDDDENLFAEKFANHEGREAPCKGKNKPL